MTCKKRMLDAAEEPEILEHSHDNLPLDHPHLKGARRHVHPSIMDDQHTRWASQL
ncbi:MAG: hypothetical protein RIE24_03245 [Silicimonas sp.]